MVKGQTTQSELLSEVLVLTLRAGVGWSSFLGLL